jgi:hypothetical protein
MKRFVDTDESFQLMSRLLSFLPLSAVIVTMSFFSAPAIADKRVALVVGNGAYRNVAQLDNPANDARLLADTLRDLGFALVGGGAQLDLDKAAFDRVVQDFGVQLQGADVALFFYAGHGVQVRGTNYLIPVNANPTREADVDFQMLDTNLVMRQMEGAGTRLNLVILDACRNNPFGGRGLAVGRGRDTGTVRPRDASSGLAQMQAPEGTLISFATQPGSVARDGFDGHSPYSKALAATIRRPGLGIFDVFNQVGLEVKRATGGAQQPWVSSSPIDGAFYFAVPQSAGPDVHRFDGTWVVNYVCETTPSGLPRLAGLFAGQASNGRFRSERGQKGTPGWEIWDGTIEPDGSIAINHDGLSGDTNRDPFHRPAGTKFFNIVIGVLEGLSGTASRTDRECNFNFAKQSVAPVSAAPVTANEPDLRQMRRFDGIWLSSVHCKGADLIESQWQFLAQVKDGSFHGEHGEFGKPGSDVFDGIIKADGTAEISSSGFSTLGTKYSLQMLAKFEDSQGTGVRLAGTAGTRICDFVFTKRSPSAVAALAPPAPISTERPKADRPGPPIPPASISAPAITTLDVRRFDGTWLVTIGCPRANDALPWRFQDIGEVKESIFHSEHTAPRDAEAKSSLDGKIGSDGSAQISFKGTKGQMSHLPSSHIIIASFQGARGTGTWNEGPRTCTLELERKGEANFAPASLSPEKPTKESPTSADSRAPATVTGVPRTAALSGSAAPAIAPDVHRFDGLWKVTIHCEQVSLSQPKWATEFVGTAIGGVFHAQRGQNESKPGWETFDGTIKSDGWISIREHGIVAENDPLHRPIGTAITFAIEGRLEDLTGTGALTHREECDVRFAKRSGTAGSALPTPEAGAPRSAAAGASAMPPAKRKSR